MTVDEHIYQQQPFTLLYLSAVWQNVSQHQGRYWQTLEKLPSGTLHFTTLALALYYTITPSEMSSFTSQVNLTEDILLYYLTMFYGFFHRFAILAFVGI